MGAIKGRKTTTSPLKWNTAMGLLAQLSDDKEYETRLMFAIGFFTGLRISDILALRWLDIMGETMEIQEKKTSKYRRIDVNRKLSKVIRDSERYILPEDYNDFLFTGKRGTNGCKPLTVVGANNRIKRMFKKYGIKTLNPSSHTLRKTFGKRVYEINFRSEDALILLSEIFNHSNISITRKYIGITAQRITNVYLSL